MKRMSPARARTSASSSREQMRFWRRLKRHTEVFEANRHLEAYRFDRDPLHILRAVLAAACTGRPLSKIMQGNLRHAIAELSKSAKASNTPRDLRVVRSAMASNGGALPKRLHPNVKADIARSENISTGHVSVILSRYRARLKGKSR
jgi:hypothetical protein